MKTLLTFVIFSMVCNCFAQSPVTEWELLFGGTGDDYGFAINETWNNEYIVAGWTNSWSAQSRDAYILTVDKSGNQMWDKITGWEFDEYTFDICQTSDYGFVVTGYTKSYTHGLSDVFLYKTDMKGDSIWMKKYGLPSSDAAYSIRETSDKGFILTGMSSVYTKGD